MKSKELKTYNLPEDRIMLSKIDAKPTELLFVFFVAGIFLLVFRQYIWGIAIISGSICAAAFLPSRTLAEFYFDFMVLYNHANKNTCEIIYYDDVVAWNYSYGMGYDTLNIRLVDDSSHNVDGFSRFLFENHMNRYLKDKKEKKKKTKNKV